MSESLAAQLDGGGVVLGGCDIANGVTQYHCNTCGAKFGESGSGVFMDANEQLAAVVYGAAVGDALGVPFEFKPRDTFTCTTMTDGGAHQVPKGTFSDDTSLMLATCDSIRACGGRIDIEDMRERFRAWLYKGAYTADGVTFDVGNTTATALDEGAGCTGEFSNGNGSLMRIAPLAFIPATDEEIRAVSAITHAHAISTTACVAFVHILRDVLGGVGLEDAIVENIAADGHFDFMRNMHNYTRDEIPSSGYVLHTLKAALWCALMTESYSDCVLTAVNLGSDTDTTACVAGALAGALYGCGAIPPEWLEELRGKDIIASCLFNPA